MRADELTIRLCRPDEQDECLAVERQAWAPFNWEAQGAVGVDYFPALHVVAVAPDDRIVATIDGCPMAWDGDPDSLPEGGWTDVVLAAQQLTEWQPYACALGASILPEAQGGGLARRLLEGLRDAACAAGFFGMLAPVRPTAWTRMPHLTIGQYAQIRLPDGRHFDPWARTHERVGGTIIGSCHASAVFAGGHADWERWTGTRLPWDGSVIAPRTAGWLELRDGHGVLTESSLWLWHDLLRGQTAAGAGTGDDPAVTAVHPDRHAEPEPDVRDVNDMISRDMRLMQPVGAADEPYASAS